MFTRFPMLNEENPPAISPLVTHITCFIGLGFTEHTVSLIPATEKGFPALFPMRRRARSCANLPAYGGGRAENLSLRPDHGRRPEGRQGLAYPRQETPGRPLHPARSAAPQFPRQRDRLLQRDRRV